MTTGEDLIRGLGKLGLPLTIMVPLTPKEQKRKKLKEKRMKEVTNRVRTLEAEGISVKIVEVNLTAEDVKWIKQVNRDVDKYVAELEEAHERAKHSKLHFGAVCPLTAS
jgi:DNA repair exonuclease SbcCD ATPase subunit